MFQKIQQRELEGLGRAEREVETQRMRGNPFAYSLLTVLCPLAVLMLGVWTVNLFVDSGMIERLSSLPIDKISPKTDGSAIVADLYSRVRIAGPQAALFVISLSTIVIAAWVSSEIVRAHARVNITALFFVVIGLVLLLYTAATLFLWPLWQCHLKAAHSCPGDIFSFLAVKDFYLYVTTEILRKLSYADAMLLLQSLEENGRYGGLAGITAAISIILCCSILAYRWRGEEWLKPDVLRRQMTFLLTLFALASALLVFANAAARGMIEWPLNVLLTPPFPASAMLDELKLAVSGFSSWIGIISAAILIATFIPAFASLVSDIALAGRLAAIAAAGQVPLTVPPTYADIKKWKETNGLALSVAEIATAIVAAAAPLLTAPAIDLTKALVVPH